MKTAWLKPSDLRWSNALENLEHDVYHLPKYCELAASDEGGEALAFWAEHEGSTLLVPLLERQLKNKFNISEKWTDAASPYGYPSPILSPNADSDFF